MLEATELRWSGCAFRYLITIAVTCSAVTPVVPALAVSGVMDKAVSATRPASKAATDFERIFSGKVLAVLNIVSSLGIAAVAVTNQKLEQEIFYLIECLLRFVRWKLTTRAP